MEAWRRARPFHSANDGWPPRRLDKQCLLMEVRYLLATPKHQQRYATWSTTNSFPSARDGGEQDALGARHGFWLKIEALTLAQVF